MVQTVYRSNTTPTIKNVHENNNNNSNNNRYGHSFTKRKNAQTQTHTLTLTYAQNGKGSSQKSTRQLYYGVSQLPEKKKSLVYIRNKNQLIQSNIYRSVVLCIFFTEFCLILQCTNSDPVVSVCLSFRF